MLSIDIAVVTRIQVAGTWHDVAAGSLTFGALAYRSEGERVWPDGPQAVPAGVAFRTSEGATVAAPVERIDAVETRRD